jgi:hypothetical protein
MDAQHPGIKFEIEHPIDEYSLSLLDLTVTVKPNESLKFEHFKKPAKKNIFINYKSALPEPMKINIIRNERKRISERCSSNQSIRTHNIKFDNLLSSNGYPTHIIDKSYHPQQTSIRNPTNDFHCQD